MRRFRAPSMHGFTLLELMVVLAILGLLAALALPSYQESVLRAGRADGKRALLQVAANQERFYSVHNSYSLNAQPLSAPPVAALDSPEGRYRITVAACEDGAIGHCFVATATAQGSQSADACGALSLSSIGVRGASGTRSEECWQR